MSYGLKYYGEFMNYFDESIRVNIYGRDYSGDSTEVKLLEETPLVISYPGDDQDIHKAIFGSQAKVRMLSETDFQFIDLHTTDSRGYRLDVLKDGTLDWRGWIIPDLFSEPYVAPPYPVEITARCGLGEMKERYIPEQMTKLLTTTILTIDVDTFVNLYSIIGNALIDIETSLPMNDCINVHHTLTADENDSALFDTWVNIEMYEGLSFYDAVEDILKTFGARLYQQAGEWWIVRINEFKETLTARKWTLSRPINNSFVLSETKLTTFLVGKPTYDKDTKTGGLIVNNAPSLDILPAWKEFDIIQKLEKKENIIENGLFEEWENDYSTRIGRSKTNFYIKDWVEPYPGFAKRYIDSEGNSFVQLDPDATGSGLSQTIDDVENIDLFVDKQKLKFKIQFDILSYSTAIENARFAILIKTEGLPFDRYLVPDDESEEGFSWETTSQVIEIEDVPVSYYGGRYNRAGRVNFDWKTFEFMAPGFRTDGTFTIEILPAYYDIWTNVTASENVRLRLNEVSCVIVDANEVGFIDELNINTVVNENNIYIPDELNVIGGDLPDIPNNLHIWKNYYAKSDGTPTNDWKEKDETTKEELLELLAKDYKRRVGKPQFKLSIPILSPVVNFDSCLVDYMVENVKNKKYLCNSASINYRTSIMQGTFIEFAEYESDIWILADGTWNDSGVWIDSETWNDDDTNLVEIELSNRTPDGLFDITTQTGISSGDTIDQLLPDADLFFGDRLYEDSVLNEIDSVPYSFTGSTLYFYSSPAKSQSYTTQFKATISSISKTVKINVNL